MLDFSAPFGEVHGIQGVRFSQSGRFFSHKGCEVDVFEEDGGTRVVALEEDAGVVVPDISEHIGPKPFRDMHWKQLKALVESYGGSWTDKEAALIFLRGSS